MAKSADDIRLITFPTQITEFSSVIGDDFEDCCAHNPEEEDSTYRAGSRYVVNEVCLTFLVLNSW